MSKDNTTYKVIKTEQCPKCKEEGRDSHKDNLQVYSDESAHCFNPVCNYNISNQEAAGGDHIAATPVVPVDPTLVRGQHEALVERGITKATCEKYNVRIGIVSGAETVIYPIYEGATVVKQKLRDRINKKIQKQVGDTDCTELFGKSVFNPSGMVPIIVTEGEYDAMCVYQATGFSAVSGVRGAGGIYKELKANLEWMMKWKFVTLCFDDDECGQKAVEECMSLFEPGAVRVAKFPLKDANEMVLANRSGEIKTCLYNATILKPKTLVTIEDVWDRVLEKPTYGESWPFPTMTKITYGLQWGALYLIAAAKGIGKTQLLQEIMIHLMQKNIKVGLFGLEQTPQDTIRRFIGSMVGSRIHLPGDKSWDEDLVKKFMVDIKDQVVLCDKGAGKLTLATVLINIRYAAKCYGAKLFVIDNLKKLAACPIIDGKRVPRVQFMSEVMTSLSATALELDISIFVIQHVNQSRPNINVDVMERKKHNLSELTEGLRYESGRVPSMEDIYGSGEITDLADHVIVLSRNRTSKSQYEKNILKVTFLQTRLDGTYDGKSFDTYFSPATGRLTEDLPEDLKLIKEKELSDKQDREDRDIL